MEYSHRILDLSGATLLYSRSENIAVELLMNIDVDTLLKHKALNGWRLFWLVAIPMSIIIVVEILDTDLSVGTGVAHMISYSVRFAVPFIFLVVPASSVQILFPGSFPMWWLRNRKYIGMCFAVAMAWQGLFIFIMSFFFRDYYYEDVYLLRDELEGSIGYILLPLMVVTSFNIGRKFLNARQWKLLHKTGIYFLFAYPFVVYWWRVAHYYGTLNPGDYVFYLFGFTAFALRIAAWGKKRQQAMQKNVADSGTPLAYKVFGGVFIAFGLFVAATPMHWQKAVSAFLTAPQWSADLELWLPYWPLEPFLSLFILGFGTALLTRAKY